MRCATTALLCVLLLGTLASAEEPAPGGAGPAPQRPAAAPPGMVPMTVQRVMLVDDAPAVLLIDAPRQRFLLVFVDYFMATSIRMGLDGMQLERPLTHDLIGILLRRLGAKVTRVAITELKNSTYFSLITVQVNATGEVTEFDARPSDALAIAVRNGAPIYVAASLLRPLSEGVPLPGEQPPAPAPPAKGET